MQHHEHQDVDRGFARGGDEVNGDAAHHADQQRCDHHAPETAEPADDDHDKGDRDDFGAHRGMHDGDRREEGAAERGHADAEHHDRGHVGLQADAKRRHHVRPLDAGAHHPAERGLVQQKPDAEQHGRHHGEDQKPIAREQEIADEDRAAKGRRDRGRQRSRAPDDADRLLGDHRQPKGHEQAQDRIGGVEAAQDEPLEDRCRAAPPRPATARWPGRSPDIS